MLTFSAEFNFNHNRFLNNQFWLVKSEMRQIRTETAINPPRNFHKQRSKEFPQEISVHFFLFQIIADNDRRFQFMHAKQIFYRVPFIRVP